MKIYLADETTIQRYQRILERAAEQARERIIRQEREARKERLIAQDREFQSSIHTDHNIYSQS